MTDKTYLETALQDGKLRRLYQQELLLTRVLELVTDAMAKSGVNQSELARRLGISRQAVSALLSGRNNVTVRRIAEVLDALDYEMVVGLRPLSGASQAHTWTRLAGPRSASMADETRASRPRASRREGEERRAPELMLVA